MRGPRARDPARTARRAPAAAVAARRARPADRGRRRDRDLERGRSVRAGAEHGALSRPAARRVRRGGGDAVGRHRVAPRAARDVAAPRPGERCRAGEAGGAAGGHHLGRRDSGQRQLSGRGRAGGDDGGHRRRGLRRGEHGRRHLSAGDDVVAHPARRVRAPAGGGRPRRGAVGAVLARRGARADAGALRGGVGCPRAAGCARRCASRRGRCGGVPDPGVRTRPVRRGAGRGLRPGRAAPRSAPCRPSGPWSPNASSTRGAACSSCCTRRSGRPSTAPGAWRCASGSAAASTSSCRRPRPTTAS